jgi:hypothetical protein
MPGINSPLIGASITQRWSPTHAIGAASDAQAPFQLGTRVQVGTPTGAKGLGEFCRVANANIAAAGTAGITNGVTVAAATGNTWTWNGTDTALVGDYVFLTAQEVTTP